MVKRLISNKYKQFIYLFKVIDIIENKIDEIENITMSSKNNNNELNFLKLAHKITTNKLIKLAKFDYNIYYEFFNSELRDYAHKLANYQDDEKSYALKPNDLDYDLLEKYVPEALYKQMKFIEDLL